ncbi:hypothetical protein E4U41_000036 [Claviceps citrina]|nr:hypothetical protein E4U41_000036 [Claviceps citrina]
MHGCPASYIVQDCDEADLNLFSVDVTVSKKLIDPCFLVPAIIDALKKHPTYRSVIQVVPGEADQFCAEDVSRKGGTVLTSDSDLLVHDLGHGRVAFFRDIREDSLSRITFASFVPEKIFKAIGLRYPEKALQLAYERQLSPNANFSQIILKSSRPLSQSAAYLKFQEQFTTLGSSNFMEDGQSKLPFLNSQDPRISEMVMEFYLLRKGKSLQSPIRMFLPPLLECPTLRSAWDPSTCIRQLAYSVGKYSLNPGHEHPTSVHEFRRVQTLSSTGREIRLLSLSLAKRRMKEIVSCSTKLKGSFNCGDHRFWIALGIALETSDSQQQDREPVLLRIYERINDLKPSRIHTHGSWADIHLYAQIQGILYSFRILQQVLEYVGLQPLKQEVMEIGDVRAILSQLPPVAHFPNFDDSLGAVNELCQGTLLESISSTIPTARAGGLQIGHNVSHTEETETVDKDPLVDCTVPNLRSLHRNNMFSSLFTD